MARVSLPMLASVVVAVLLLALMLAVPGSAQPLRDRHGDPLPGVSVPAVVVTADGKLFHALQCPYVHGPATVEDPAAARTAGYVPCPRCLGHLR